MRTCKDCGSSISHRASQAKRCESCARVFKAKKMAEKYKENGHKKQDHICDLCGVSFTNTRRESKRCRPCQMRGNKAEYEYFWKGALAYKHKAIAKILLSEDEYKIFHVHHIDGNGLNNSLNNLIAVSREDHAKIHSIFRNKSNNQETIESITNQWISDNSDSVIIFSKKAQETGVDVELALSNLLNSLHKSRETSSNGQLDKPDIKVQNVCGTCGILFNPRFIGSKFCSRLCSDKRVRGTECPDYAVLLSLIYKIPSLEIAKKYGVSDSAVVKWCKKLGIQKPPRGYWAKKYSDMAKSNMGVALTGGL